MNKEVIDFQLDILKIEISSIQEVIARLDQFTQTTKNWSVTMWAGGLGFAITQVELRDFALVTAVIPLIFWILDAWWRRLQKRSIYRQLQISKFLNSEDLSKSISNQKLVGFTLLDPVGTAHKNEDDYKVAVSFKKTLLYPEVAGFYLPLMAISLIVGIFFLIDIV